MTEVFKTLVVGEITHVAHLPDHDQAMIAFTAIDGSKIALISDLSNLWRAVSAIAGGKSPSNMPRTNLGVVDGGKA